MSPRKEVILVVEGDDAPFAAIAKEVQRLDSEVKRISTELAKAQYQVIQCMERMVEISLMIEENSQH